MILLYLAIMLVMILGLVLWLRTKSSASTPATNVASPQPSLYPEVKKFAIPILMYHYIRVAPANDQLGANLSVSPENFKAQMKYLYDNNYRTIKLADLADPRHQAISRIYFAQQKPIVITFDDGYEDAYTEAFPTLKNFGFIGTFFIIKDYIGREGRLNQSQIEEMTQAGMEFGSHTLSHSDLTKISINEARRQIFASKGDYQIFCYPAGRFNDQVVALVKEAGYSVAVTTKIGLARENSNLFELPRVRVENTDVQAFANKISYANEYGSK